MIPYIVAHSTPPNIMFFCFNSRVKNRFHTIVVQAIRFAKIAQRKPVDRVSFHILDLAKEKQLNQIEYPILESIKIHYESEKLFFLND